MLKEGSPREWGRPSHAEIRKAMWLLGPDGTNEIREALTGGCEPFEKQMNRRMKTRRADLRPAYKTLRQAGEEKVRANLASLDMEGLRQTRRRRRKPGRSLVGTR